MQFGYKWAKEKRIGFYVHSYTTYCMICNVEEAVYVRYTYNNVYIHICKARCGTKRYVEWINASSANIVFKSPEGAQKAHHRIAHETIYHKRIEEEVDDGHRKTTSLDV